MSPQSPQQSTPLIHPHAVVSAQQGSGPAPDATFTSFMSQARKRFRLAADAENMTRLKSNEDFRFYEGDGKQWPDAIRMDRDASGRPCLEINKVKSNAQQILNEQRQSRPAIQVNPMGDGADVDTAEIIQGLIRHIEVNSQADIAYDTAFEHAVIGGFGYIRVLTEWEHGKSFNQEIKVKRVIDPFTVYFDPNAQEHDYSDAEFCFIVEDLTVDQFKARYPRAQKTGLSEFRSVGDDTREWYSTETIRIADYYYVDTVEKTLVLLADGKTCYDDELPEDPAMPGFSGMEVAQARGGLRLKGGSPVTRKTYERVIQWCKMSALEKLEEGRVPGEYIPVIPVLGYELIVNGKRSLSGTVRNAKDPQRQYNYQRSAIVEAIALAPKAPWMIPEGADENYEEEFKQSNVRNIAAIHYKPTSLDDKLVPPPQRQNVEPAIQAMTAAMVQADQDLDAAMSVYPSSRGQVGPEQSGKAILARTRRTEIANFNFGDNLSRAVCQVGRVILCMIREVYDVAMIKRVVDPDGSHRMVQINQEFESSPGVMKIFDVTVGRYDISITAGLQYQSARQEFVDAAMALTSTNPALFTIIGDLLIKAFDWPGAQEISQRLYKMLPQQLQDPADGSEPLPPAAQQHIMQLTQQLAQVSGELAAAQEIIKTKQIEGERAERIQNTKSLTQIFTALANSKSLELQQLAKMDAGGVQQELEHRQQLLHANLTMEQEAAQHDQERQHAQQMAQQQMAHEQGLAAQQQGHERQLAAMQPAPAGAPA